MQRCSSFICALSVVMLYLLSAMSAFASNANISGLSEWDVTSFKVDLLSHQGANGDIQVDQNEWVHLGANHLEGGDISYLVQTGPLTRSDILEVWVDGFSTSNSLDIGPTLFVGTGKNRFEQINRVSGDAWRPFVFRFADDAQYGDVTDPSNRNENWRIRYPSSKYEVRRIDKAPNELLDYQTLPVRISITGAEDFIIKRLEVVVYRSGHGGRTPLRFIAGLSPYQVRSGDRITLKLSPETRRDDLSYYIVDTEGREHRVHPQLGANRDQIWFYAKGSAFSRSGGYRVKVVDRSSRGQQTSDSEYFEYTRPRVVQQPKPSPAPMIEACVPPCLPAVPLPGIPQIPPAGIVPVVPPGTVFGAPGTAWPQVAPIVPVVPPAVVAATGVQNGFTIQIGAFSAQSSAASLVNKLRSYGYDAYVSESMKGNSRLFRVRVGRYASKSHARQDAGSLRQRGFETWITTMS